jgi:outer membrane protein insertion porin family
VAIRVVGEAKEVLDVDLKNLPLQPGEPFSLDAERESLRQLFRTGRYAEIVAQTAAAEGGVRLDFVVQRNFYVNSVWVASLHEPPSESVAQSAIRLPLGEIFRESDMPAALDRLKRTLEDEGLYESKITYQLTPHADTRQMDITVNVVPGPRARVGEIAINNLTTYPDAVLKGRLKLGVKSDVTSEVLDRSVDRVRKWLTGRGYLGARVSIVRGDYNGASNQVPLKVEVAAGLNVRVQIDGAKISRGKLHQLLPLYQEGAVDEDLLVEGRNNLRDYFERQGYFDTTVSYTTSQVPASAPPATGAELKAAQQEAEVITYQVSRGVRRKLVGMAFDGNRYFDHDLLRSRVHIQPAAFASPGRFSSGQLSDDVASIVGLYQANGFRQVQVKSELMENYRGKAGEVFVRFHIVEGPQTRIAGLKLEGNHALSDAELSRVIGSTPGEPFSDFNVAGDRDNVLALYYNQGFPEAHFQAMIEEVPAVEGGSGPQVQLVYHIDEGAQLRIARVLFSGEVHTRASTIRREIKLQTDKPLSEGAVVDTQRKLYGLGIFNRVSIAPQNPTGSDTDKTIDVLLEETQRYTIAYGLGFEVQRLGSAGTGPVAEPLHFSPRVTFEATKLNLTGRADTLSFKVRASTLQGRGLLSYVAPNYFGRPSWSLDLNALYDKTRDVETFTSTRSEVSAGLTDQITPSTSFHYRYVYRHVLASDLQVAPEEIPLFSQPTDVSFVSFSWLRERRDSPADPTRGSFNNADIDLASRHIGSSASFLRATFQNSTYTHISRRLVFARSTRVGIEQALGQSTADDIPLPERFFAGGGTSLRGFGLNEAGPRDPLTGFPVGGLGSLVFNQQLQFPMHLPKLGDQVGGAIFYDAGNVFSSFSRINLRWAAPTPLFSSTEPSVCMFNCGNQLNYFSHTVGFEFRYHTPVGPVSIDLAYQLNPAQFLIPTGSTTGACATTTCTSIARLPAFQFFVNLGTSF